MAPRGSHLGLAAILAVALWVNAASAQSSSCMSTIIGLSPCLNYITGNASTPTSSCCTQLASVVSSKPQCLCMVLNGGVPSLGITINRTRALELPGACQVKTPPVSQCNDINGGAPAAAPSSIALAPGGSKAGPAAAPSPSDGNHAPVPIFFIVSSLFIAAHLLATSANNFWACTVIYN